MTKENINFRRICFQSIDLCCWWHVVHLVTVHENLANHMVLTGPALFIYCLASKDSWKCMKQEWQVAVIGKWMGRNSGQQFNSSYFIMRISTNLMRNHSNSFCFPSSTKMTIILMFYTSVFLSLLNHKRSYIIKFALCKLVLLLSMTTPRPLFKRVSRL